jgi:hypothetical protein
VHGGGTLRSALFVALALLPCSARAYRPFNGTDAAVSDKGEVEIELAPLGFVKEGPERFVVAPGAVVNWGFADGWEAVLEGRHFIQLGDQITTPRFRVDDIALSAKHVLREGSLQERSGISVATEIGALLPTVNGDSGVGVEGAVIASQRWQAIAIHLNLAVALTRTHVLGVFGSAIFEGPGSWPVRPVAEVFAEDERDLPTALSGLVGAIWRIDEAISLDSGLRLARAGGINTIELRAGLTWTFSVGFPR